MAAEHKIGGKSLTNKQSGDKLFVVIIGLPKLFQLLQLFEIIKTQLYLQLIVSSSWIFPTKMLFSNKNIFRVEYLKMYYS